MGYPSTTDNLPTNMQGTTLLADVSGDAHNLHHQTLGSAVNAIETVLGTTPGTNLLRNVANPSDQILVANFGGSVFWTLTGGTVNKGVMGSYSIIGGTLTGNLTNNGTITGGTINSPTIGTPTLILGSDAPRDIFFRSPAGSINRLPAGTANQQLSTQGTGNDPKWVNGLVASGGSVGIKIQGGTFSFTGNNAAQVSGSQSFPDNFSAIPAVVLTIQVNGNTGGGEIIPSLNSVQGTTGFSWFANCANGTTVSGQTFIMNWMAIGSA